MHIMFAGGVLHAPVVERDGCRANALNSVQGPLLSVCHLHTKPVHHYNSNDSQAVPLEQLHNSYPLLHWHNGA